MNVSLTQGVTVNRRARLFAFGVLIATALMLALVFFSTNARAAKSDPTTTIVLVHGAFASPAGWDEVAAALHKDGYGGFVITNTASGCSDVRGLVYTAAYVPDSGETITSLSDGYAPGAFLAHLLFAPFPVASVDPQFFPEDFAQDLNPKLGAEIAAEQRPTSLDLFGTPSGPAASWYAVSGHDRAIDPALQRFMAQRAGSTTVEFSPDPPMR